MSEKSVDFQRFHTFVRSQCPAIREIILQHYHNDVEVDYKADETPVTVADRETEKLLRSEIRGQFPEHGIIGEEYGSENPDAEYNWVLDPIDGTKSFVAGVPLFGTLIALLHRNRPLYGAIYFPIGDDLVTGDGETTLWNQRSVKRWHNIPLEKSVVVTTDYKDYGLYRDRSELDRLLQQCRISRTWGDCFGYFLLVSGGAQVMVDPILEVWDKMALIPIIKGIGGEITNYEGGDPTEGNSIVATTGGLHDQVISILNDTSAADRASS